MSYETMDPGSPCTNCEHSYGECADVREERCLDCRHHHWGRGDGEQVVGADNWACHEWTCDGGCGRPMEIVRPPAWEHDGATLCGDCVLDVVWDAERLRNDGEDIPHDAVFSPPAFWKLACRLGRAYRERQKQQTTETTTEEA